MIAYADLCSGISGDMFLGALIDLGVPKEWIEQQLSQLFPGFEIDVKTVYPHHIRAISVTVRPTQEEPGHRHYPDIRAMIEGSALSDTVKQGSLEAFRKIAAAESRIHGQDIEAVHFHEVGAIDSLVDIIGTFLGLEYLGIDTVYASLPALGSGTVKCAHGVLPVPVPATLAILKDTPVTASDARTEIVTPTGAALIKTVCKQFGSMPRMTIKKTGFGAGKRETGSALPNVLRLVMGISDETQAAGYIHKEQVYAVKANIDDMNPEVAGFLMEELLEQQALDVGFVPVQMKKNRPGLQMEVICRPRDLDRIVETMLTQTTTIGVRYTQMERACLEREIIDADTRYGLMQVKKIINPDGTVRHVPEYEAVRAAAKKNAVPVKDVYAHVLSDMAALDTDHNSI